MCSGFVTSAGTIGAFLIVGQIVLMALLILLRKWTLVSWASSFIRLSYVHALVAVMLGITLLGGTRLFKNVGGSSSTGNR